MSEIQNFKRGGPVKKGGSSKSSGPSSKVVSNMRQDKKDTSRIVKEVNQKKARNNLAKARESIAKDKKGIKPVSGNVSSNGRGNKNKKGKILPGPGPDTGGGYEFPPILPDYSVPDPPPPPVRVPERDVVELLNQTVDSATIQNLLFENIGANELTRFVRHDTVEGINPYYNIISNLSDIKRKFDPSSLVSLQKNDSSLFDIYAINLDDKIPSEEYLQENNLLNYVYFDVEGNLIIEVVNMSDSELVEVEIDRNGTIYEVEEL